MGTTARMTRVHCLIGCNNGIGVFHENLVIFWDPEMPSFIWAQKMRLKKCSCYYNKKSGKSVAPKYKMAENLLRIDHHRPKIGLNPNFLGYSNSPWTGTNILLWVKSVLVNMATIFNNFQFHKLASVREHFVSDVMAYPCSNWKLEGWGDIQYKNDPSPVIVSHENPL